MSRKALFSGVLAIALLGGLVPAAMADVFHRTVDLSHVGGDVMLGTGNLKLGDTVSLTLVNPTNRALTLSTSENLGDRNTWLIPANSQITMDYMYSKPFTADVSYMIRDANIGCGPCAARTISGVIFRAERPVSYEVVPPVIIERPVSRPVRGYW